MLFNKEFRKCDVCKQEFEINDEASIPGWISLVGNLKLVVLSEKDNKHYEHRINLQDTCSFKCLQEYFNKLSMKNFELSPEDDDE